ncbi:hypothetical protein ABZX75_06005 [Streptomyces sp. NPDC003038]
MERSPSLTRPAGEARVTMLHVTPVGREPARLVETVQNRPQGADR